jgi:hypothetical protein
VTGPPSWGKSRSRVVRLVCMCGRNIADVRPLQGERPPLPAALRDTLGDTLGGHDDRLAVVTRPGVRYAEHPRGGGAITYRWDCRCRRTHEYRDDRLDAIWREFAEPGHVVRVMLGHDVM